MIKQVLKGIVNKLTSVHWELGICREGLEDILNGDFHVDWIKSPYKDRWFADPFILDFDNEHIYVLAEEFPYQRKIARIVKLTVRKYDLSIVDNRVVLELPTHLSFPNILRKNNKIYVYPENCNGGKQNIYEYDAEQEKLIFKKTICDDAIWDASITDYFDRPQLWAAKKDDYHLDIYEWDGDRFVHSQSIKSDRKDSRLAGQLFKVGEDIYYPAQDCTNRYGEAIIIKKVVCKENSYELVPVKTLRSPHPRYNEGFHTLNEYRGMVIVDTLGFDYPFLGKWVSKIVKIVK